MPGGDGTGPGGQGPLTGRGMGYCNGNPTPGYMNPGFSAVRGVAPGGRARGLRNMSQTTGVPGYVRQPSAQGVARPFGMGRGRGRGRGRGLGRRGW